MTIIKIKNPILRVIAGFLTMAVVLAVAVGLSYGVGRLVLHGEGNSFSDYFWHGLAAIFLTVVAAALVIMLAVTLGGGVTGNWFFDIVVGLGTLVVLYGGVFVILHLLGRLVVLIWPALYLGSGFMEYVMSGLGAMAGLGVLGLVVLVAYIVGERFYDP